MSSFDLGEIFLWSLSEWFALASVFPPQHLLRWGKKGGKFKCSSLFEAAYGFSGLCPQRAGLLGLGFAGTCP